MQTSLSRQVTPIRGTQDAARGQAKPGTCGLVEVWLQSCTPAGALHGRVSVVEKLDADVAEGQGPVQLLRSTRVFFFPLRSPHETEKYHVDRIRRFMPKEEIEAMRFGTSAAPSWL